MDPTSPLPAVAALLAATATAHLLSRRSVAHAEPGRYATIDGLRGYLAFFVFLHHGCIWWFFLREGQWRLPPSNLYTHFGKGSVALFFMITGFLFFSKLLDARGREIDWTRLYVSRVLRLVPLYLFAVAAMFAIVVVLSSAERREPWGALGKQLAHWLLFTFFDAPDINGVERTRQLVAGVTWSLPYEWLFYLSLPALALAVRVVPPPVFLLLSAFAVFVQWRIQLELHHLISFGGGIAAALLVRAEAFRRLAVKPALSLVVLASLASTVVFFPTARGLAPNLLLSLAFALIAGGNSLFGLLLTRAAHCLGEMAYSLYLLHGLVLFLAFRFAVGYRTAGGFGAHAHWLVAAGLTPFLVLTCHATFRLIEKPAMDGTPRITAALRRLWRP